MTRRQQLIIFFFGVVCVAASQGVHDSVFNNFLDDNFVMGPDTRGNLEFPREFPGLMVVLMAGVLCMLTVTQMGIVGVGIYVAGMLCMAFWGDTNFWVMVVFMTIISAGMHLLQPVAGAIVLSLADEGRRGRRMAQLGVVRTLGAVIGSGLVWLLADGMSQYSSWFLVGAAISALAALAYFRLHLPHLHQARSRLVFRKKYWLYYLLEFLFGGRKQIFITFGFWVLVKEYHQNPPGIARLILVASLLGLGFKPLTGWTIDHFGERAVMVADGIILAVVCLGYGFAPQLTSSFDGAALLASACFIADNMLFALGSARSVYVSRLTDTHQELTSTLAMGVSINHVASMVIPAIGGAVWAAFGYDKVFVAAAIFALSISAVSLMAPGRHLRAPSEAS